MPFFWKRAASQDHLVVSWFDKTLSYVLAGVSNRKFVIKHMGVEHQGADTLEDFAERLTALGLADRPASVMLTTEQSLLLQIAAPSVPAEELRSAARYQIRDMVDVHIDDLTIDVLSVGDGQDKSAGQLFVVAAANTVVREAMALAKAMQWSVSVIDIQELAQRNLQTALAQQEGQEDRATALLLVVSDKQALLTISAKGELYYSRRLELPSGFLSMDWGAGVEFFEESTLDAYTTVTEYVPAYAAGGSDDSLTTTGQSDSDRAQRLVVEVQRSLDLWDRTWTALPLAGLSVFATERTADLSTWLSQELGQVVGAVDVAGLFDSLPEIAPADLMACMPLLGALMRTDLTAG